MQIAKWLDIQLNKKYERVVTNRKSMRQQEYTSGNSALQNNTKKLGKLSYRKCPLKGGSKNKSHQQIMKEVPNR